MLQSLPVCLFVGWVLLMVLPPFALWMLRSSWLDDLDSPNVQAEWNEFRDDMKKQLHVAYLKPDGCHIRDHNVILHIQCP